MNATCPQCQTVFRVDPAKVPEAGVRARCSVCAGVFWVRREAEVAAAAAPAAVAPPPRPAPQPPAPAPKSAPQAPVAAPPAPYSAPRAAPPAVAPGSMPPAGAAAYRPATPPPPAFRPAPAIPVAVPVAPAAYSAPATPAPSPRPPAPGAEPRPRRPTNPFLSQDPEARARRLARALVSDIVVYHPAKRRDALRDGSLKLLFEEEIRKSWEEYVDQVGRELADSTTFFTDALNEILADGQPVFP